MNNNPIAQNPAPKSSSGCVPMVTLLIGLGMLAVGLLAVLNTAFGWELVLEVYGSPMEVPKHWDSTIGVLGVGVIITFVGWLIGTARFTRIYRKNKLAVILGSVAIVAGVFFLLNEYDKKLRKRSAYLIAQRDSTMALDAEADAIAESEKPAYNLYADREIRFVITNPSLDTMHVYVDGDLLLELNPYEFGDGKLTAGMHHLAAEVNGDTVEKVDLDLALRTEATVGEIVFVNVDSFFNIGVLNFQDYYDSDNRKRKNAKTINYKLQSLHWHEHIFTINVERASLVLPRHISIDFSAGNALKLVILPDEWKDDKDKAFDYAIWKFIDEEKKGYMQDGMDFFMLSPEKRKKAIKNRLKDDIKRFEAGK